MFGDNVRARRAARALPRTPQQKRKRKRREKRDKKDKTCTVITTRWYADSIRHPHTRPPRPHIAFLPNTNHHRYSPITQPCHKDTPLNQQCCDNEHKDRRGERDTVPPPHFPTHNKHGNTRQKRNGNDTRGNGQCEWGQDNVKCQTQSEDRASQHTPLPPFNRATG